MSNPTDDAWKFHQETLDATRSTMLRHPRSQEPTVRAKALYFLQELQTVAFKLHVAPLQDYPACDPHFTPLEIGWGQPCPDFNYQYLFLDGASTYRMWGRRGNTPYLNMMVQTGFWGSRSLRNLANVDFDALRVDAGGSFELVLSPQPHDGNWVQLDPTEHNLICLVREVTIDWLHDTPTEFHIERLGGPAAPVAIRAEAELNERIRCAARFVKEHVEYFLDQYERLVARAGGRNRIPVPDVTPNSNNDNLANYSQVYNQFVYDLHTDEALIVETEVPEAKYWGLQLNDFWGHWIDFMHHQGSLNAYQAKLDSDGKLRAVLAFEDPGVPNWVDVVGDGAGVGVIRWTLAKSHPVPVARKVPLAELRRHLPADTPVVTPAQRRAALDERRAGAAKRYRF
ncbi:MAG: hypothetical protein AB7Q97_25410 [Gammaproteobacteria bacterium]